MFKKRQPYNLVVYQVIRQFNFIMCLFVDVYWLNCIEQVEDSMKYRLASLNLSGTSQELPGTRPPSCTTP